MDAVKTLQFPIGDIPELERSRIVGAAVESSGYVEKGNPRVLILENVRQMYILLSEIQEADHQQNIRRLSPEWIPVNEQAFVVEEKPRMYESIGREVAWTRGMMVDGDVFVDDIREVPWRVIFEDFKLPAQATVVMSTLGRRAKLHLPPEISLEPHKEYYVSGQSIRVVDTFNSKPPGGGKRMVA